jgi:hypothetical protein
MTYNRRMPANLLIPALVSTLINATQPSVPAPQPGLSQMQAPGGVTRPMPANTKKGNLTGSTAGTVVIDGNAMPLSVAAQIRNENNLIVQPSMLQQPATVRYLTDASGAVFRMWILTAAEMAAVDRKN